jgi:uncharacterized protein YcbK (DUF882 family)
MKLTANITLDELTKSQIAIRRDINNNPSPEQIENLKALATHVLQPIRSHFDRPLIISSGFRCAELCIAINSSVNSQHTASDESAAADFEVPGVDNYELAKWIKANLDVDQGILEFYTSGEPTSGWIHCSYSRNSNRNQWLHAYKENKQTKYKPWIE